MMNCGIQRSNKVRCVVVPPQFVDGIGSQTIGGCSMRVKPHLQISRIEPWYSGGSRRVVNVPKDLEGMSEREST